MKRTRICLFTAHSPLFGGGGAVLRSLIAHLPEIDVAWHYTEERPAQGYESGYLGRGVMGGNLLKDLGITWSLLNQQQVPALDALIQQLLRIHCDGYWIVSHNEGLRVALELARLGKQVHLSVHDDWAAALCARSFRYRLMGRAADRLTRATLREVPGFDVISEGMRAYYQQLSGRPGEVCHRYLPEGSIRSPLPRVKDGLTAGHIGSIYDKKDFVSFLTLFKDFARRRNRQATVHLWGCHLTPDDMPEALRPHVQFHETLPEEVVVAQLADCDILYAMYPTSKALHRFSQTSLPTKLTSYLQATRPVFGHGPADSTLSQFLEATGTGAMWTGTDADAGFAALEKALETEPSHGTWLAARDHYFGEKNLMVMRRAFNARLL
ncbi:glycosyltransferase family 4 protein [Hufsiella ginkgonis]|uniref:Glycosyltransferase n=1 Tax=Hufsiella ginkgonis TaxID=2695274 RepID=A0A7K1Y2X6_9SPHI|nr:glycosyltransferase family 4 protein [Hufsiella ginkgonis]MXV17448.1 hypothetical protein [Hufsiella ginkgonis]